MKKKYGATIVVGGMWGDECKGKLSAFLTLREKALLVARGGVGPNAEHGYYSTETGPYKKVNQLPLGFVRTLDTDIRIGPGTCIDVDKLFREAKEYGVESRLKVDPRCPIVKPEYIEWEKEHLKGNSTYNGCGPCRSDFVLRKALQARNIPELKEYLIDVPEEINRVAKNNNVIIESSQGTFLSLALSYDYPAVTSDNVTSLAAADDVGLNWQNIKSVVLAVKTMPTREASGYMHDEMTLDEIKESGLIEYSSIGGEIRRKSKSIDFDRLRYSVEINGATEIALTFCDHYDSDMRNVVEKKRITSKMWELIKKVEKETKVPVTVLETGKVIDRIFSIK